MVKHVNNVNHQKQEPTDMDPSIFYGLSVTKNSPHKTLVRTMLYSLKRRDTARSGSVVGACLSCLRESLLIAQAG